MPNLGASSAGAVVFKDLSWPSGALQQVEVCTGAVEINLQGRILAARAALSIPVRTGSSTNLSLSFSVINLKGALRINITLI